MSEAEALLGGRVLLDQRDAGLRATIEPVLLAAAVPAQAGETVLEAGSGVGTAALCLLARVPGIHVVGVERDAAQAASAERNAARNRWEARFAAIAGDVEDPATARHAALRGPFAHAMANPPWFQGGSQPEASARRVAKHATGPSPLTGWIGFLAGRLGHRGTVTLILPTGLLPHALEAFATARVGGATVFPLWPRAGEPARRIILAGRTGGRTPCRVLAGLVLHRQGGAFTEEAEAVLRHGAALAVS